MHLSLFSLKEGEDIHGIRVKWSQTSRIRLYTEKERLLRCLCLNFLEEIVQILRSIQRVSDRKFYNRVKKYCIIYVSNYSDKFMPIHPNFVEETLICAYM